MQVASIIWFLIYLIHNASALVGYDCERRGANIARISTRDVGQCDIQHIRKIRVKEEYLQLMELVDFSQTQVIQCKVEVTRRIFNCDKRSDNNIGNKEFQQYIREVSYDECTKMHDELIYKIHNTNCYGLEINGTKTFTQTLAGRKDEFGSCYGATYEDPFGVWDSVLVEGSIKITLHNYLADVRLKNNIVELRSGETCNMKQEGCTDLDGSYAYWDPLPREPCEKKRYTVLYRGQANMTFSPGNSFPEIVTIRQDDIIFSVPLGIAKFHCGMKYWTTKHHLLTATVGKKDEDLPIATRNNKSIKMFIHENKYNVIDSQVIFVERQVNQEIQDVFRDIVFKKCKSEQKVLENYLGLAISHPDHFALNYMKSRGYTANLAGEVLYLVKCVPVEVTVRRAEECYSELPVYVGNQTAFLIPRTRIIKSRGTQISCNNILSPTYYIDRVWYKMFPALVETQPPRQLDPKITIQWQYQSLPVDAIFREYHLIRETEIQGDSLGRLYNFENVKTIEESVWSNLWTKYVGCNRYTFEIVIGVIIFIILNTMISGIFYALTLYRIYGWSFELMSAPISSLAQYYINKHRHKQRNAIPSSQYDEKELWELSPTTDVLIQKVIHGRNAEESEKFQENPAPPLPPRPSGTMARYK